MAGEESTRARVAWVHSAFPVAASRQWTSLSRPPQHRFPADLGCRRVEGRSAFCFFPPRPFRSLVAPENGAGLQPHGQHLVVEGAEDGPVPFQGRGGPGVGAHVDRDHRLSVGDPDPPQHAVAPRDVGDSVENPGRAVERSVRLLLPANVPTAGGNTIEVPVVGTDQDRVPHHDGGRLHLTVGLKGPALGSVGLGHGVEHSRQIGDVDAAPGNGSRGLPDGVLRLVPPGQRARFQVDGVQFPSGRTDEDAPSADAAEDSMGSPAS